jgi:hypothetical protein
MTLILLFFLINKCTFFITITIRIVIKIFIRKFRIFISPTNLLDFFLRKIFIRKFRIFISPTILDRHPYPVLLRTNNLYLRNFINILFLLFKGIQILLFINLLDFFLRKIREFFRNLFREILKVLSVELFTTNNL